MIRVALDEIEAKRRHFETAVNITAGERREFNIVYAETYKKARKMADNNLQKKIASKARSHTLCWDVIKKLRRGKG
jgi:hypothetical protein